MEETQEETTETAALETITFALPEEDAVDMPFFSTWEENYTPVEVTGQTEAGTDTVILVRSDKLEVNVGGVFTAETVALIEEFRAAPLFALTLPDGTEHTVRMRGYKKSLKKGSHTAIYPGGVWSVSFKLIEF